MNWMAVKWVDTLIESFETIDNASLLTNKMIWLMAQWVYTQQLAACSSHSLFSATTRKSLHLLKCFFSHNYWGTIN